MSNNPKFLAIDDNEDHIELIRLLNKSFNFQIDFGINIFDFLSHVNKFNYDVILCDLNLHYQKEGLDILKSYQQYGLKSKISAYTSNSADESFF